MRVEPFGADSIMHVVQRGTRGMDIVRDTADRQRFVKSLYYLNDTYTDANWHKTVARLPLLERPIHWPESEPLVRILAWTLLSNHFHLLLQEIREGGTAKFMQRFCGSLSMCFNKKYSEKGRLFQSSYHGRTVSEDRHFNYLAFYILIKNTLEMYPGGLMAAHADFDNAWEWSKSYPYSSFCQTVSGSTSAIMGDTDGLIPSVIGTGNMFKQEAKDLLELHMASRDEDFADIMLESW